MLNTDYALSLIKLLLLCSVIPLSSLQAQCLKAGLVNVSPYTYYNDDGDRTGIHWDYFNELERESGICIEKKILPYKRAWDKQISVFYQGI